LIIFFNALVCWASENEMLNWFSDIKYGYTVGVIPQIRGFHDAVEICRAGLVLLNL